MYSLEILPFLESRVVVGGSTTTLHHMFVAIHDLIIRGRRGGILFAQQHSNVTCWIRYGHDGTIPRTYKTTILHVFSPCSNSVNVGWDIERFTLLIVRKTYKQAKRCKGDIQHNLMRQQHLVKNILPVNSKFHLEQEPCTVGRCDPFRIEHLRVRGSHHHRLQLPKDLMNLE